MKNIFNINKKKLRYGSYSIALIVVFIAAVIGLNLVVNTIHASIDLTPNSEFTISDKTKTILKDLNDDVIIYALFDEAEFKEKYVQLDKLLDDYVANKHISLKFLNAYKNPGSVRQLDPDDFYELQPTNFLFVSGNKMKKVTISDFTTTRTDYFSGETYDELAIEETLSGAILYVTAEKTPVVYFTTGHGEIELSVVSYLNEYLTRNNFDIKTIATLTAENIPEDADMIVFMSPTKDITIEERAKLEDYFDASNEKSKALMLFVDPVEQGSDFSQLNFLLEKYNLKINNDSVKENDSEYFLAGSPFYLLPTYAAGGYKVFTPFARSIEILNNQKEYITEEPLLETSTKAESIVIGTGESTIGKLNVAVRVNYGGGFYPTRVFASGNTTFLNDTIITDYQDNLQFVLDQIRWSLSQENAPIYIEGKKAVDLSIAITQKQATTISLALIIILPLILFGAGTIIYVRRKNL